MEWTQIIVSIIGGGLLSGFGVWLFFWKYKRGDLVFKLARSKVENEQAMLIKLESIVDDIRLKYHDKAYENDKLQDQIRLNDQDIKKLQDETMQMTYDLGALFKSCQCKKSPEIDSIRQRYEEKIRGYSKEG